MNELYWITRVGALDNFFCMLWGLGLLLFVVLLLYIPLFKTSIPPRWIHRWVTRLAIIISIGIVGDIITPTKEEMLVIYGIGGTMDYLKSSDKAKQLPDKCVDALIRYVDAIEKKSVYEKH